MSGRRSPARPIPVAMTLLVRWFTRAEDREVRAGASGGAYSATDASLLQRIAEIGPVRMSGLARWHGVDRSTMTAEIRRLADRGLIGRRPDPGDARAVLVELTPRGRRVVVEHRRRTEQVVADALAGWSARDRAELARLLDKLAHAIDDADPPAGRGAG